MKKYFTCDAWQKAEGWAPVIVFLTDTEDEEGFYVYRGGSSRKAGMWLRDMAGNIDASMSSMISESFMMREIFEEEVALLLC